MSFQTIDNTTHHRSRFTIDHNDGELYDLMVKVIWIGVITGSLKIYHEDVPVKLLLITSKFIPHKLAVFIKCFQPFFQHILTPTKRYFLLLTSIGGKPFSYD